MNVRKTELLIEAVEESQEKWYEEFESIDEALKVLNGAIKEIPEEDELAIFLALMEPNTEDYFNLEKTYKNYLKRMKKDLLKDDDDED
jgi:hypothetical protein